MGERHGRKDMQFFACESCFDEYRVVYPYESARDADFICNCGGKLERVSGYETMVLFNQ